METMAELLSALQAALQDESEMLYVEGFQGLGVIVAIIMALCPNDVLVNIEDVTLFQGERQSVVISIKLNTQTRFGLETIIRGAQVRNTFIGKPEEDQFWK